MVTNSFKSHQWILGPVDRGVMRSKILLSLKAPPHKMFINDKSKLQSNFVVKKKKKPQKFVRYRYTLVKLPSSVMGQIEIRCPLIRCD